MYNCDINIKFFPNDSTLVLGINGDFAYIDEQGFITMNPKSANGEKHKKIGTVSSVNSGTMGFSPPVYDYCGDSMESISYGGVTAKFLDPFVDSINCNPFPVPTKTRKKDFTNKFKFLQL